ncbi:GntR family transcriptional regulator [Spirochaetia bacterium 38H-sp]|uniref:GntR family transcriptional regulator n=1 Tax=Rarispira pelagica TaxID=3141764 RepID=A0ABU9UAV5_9SPIR
MKNYEPLDKKYIEIAEKLKGEILTGKYKEGDKIPTIRELSLLYGVNPQTVNKATAYLASMGYLQPRQGIGSFVTRPSLLSKNHGIWMLVDKNRSRLFSNLNEVSSYHAKDIYLSYLLEMNQRDVPGGFFIYEEGASKIPEDFREKARSAEGFIVQGSLPDSYISFLVENNIPTVLINRRIPDKYKNKGRLGSVLIDNKPLEQLVNYLVSMGHKRLLYLLSSEFEENEVFKERLSIVRKTLEGWGEGVHFDIFKYHPGDPDYVESFKKKIGDGFSAGVGYNDISALGIYSLAHMCGMSIPENFSVVGFDDIMASSSAVPPLTTIRVDRGGLVLKAIEVLDVLIRENGNCYIEELFPTSVVFRRSVVVRAL